MDLKKYTKKELIWIIEELQRMAKLAKENRDEYVGQDNAWSAVGCGDFLISQVLNTEGYADMVEFKKFIEEA